MFLSVSFLRQRFQTQAVYAQVDVDFEEGETFIFDFIGENDQIRFDAAMLLKLN